MSNDFRVSQSKLKTWRRCKRQYHYKYVAKLRARKKSRPLGFGSLIHRMIEADAEGKDPFEAMNHEFDAAPIFAEEREFFRELREDVEDIMTEYFEFWQKQPLAFIKHGRIRVEHEFTVSVEDGLTVTGKIDGHIRAKRMSWLLENKSFSKPPNEDDRWRSIQGSVYIRIVQMLGWRPVDGMLWNYIRSKPPTMPQLKKNGELSARSIDSLPSRIVRAFEIMGVPITEKHRALMSAARENRTRYFWRVFSTVKPGVVDRLFSDFITTAREAREAHGKTQVMTIDRHCSWCEFEPLCRAELTGGDTDFLVERDFYEKKDGETTKSVIAG